MGKKLRQKNFIVDLSEQDLQDLYMIVEKKGVTVSSFVRLAVDERLKKFGHTIAGEI
ncbi:MAG: hypothetical protein GH151_09390 [Bacteroidetes bacterium]|nr:hypothetical protein [Bacteroidota bacterium]